MREIKFRIWDKAKQMMRNICEESSGRHWSTLGDDNFVLMQFTGLKDKNGKEIYEGDILSAWMQEIKEGKTYDIPINSKVIWSDGQWLGMHPKSYQSLRQWYVEKCEVIGNIWENAELLKGWNYDKEK